MEPHTEAIVRSLVAMAWADGRMDDTERAVLDALVAAFELSDDDANIIKEYAAEPRTLDDVPLTELSGDDRRLLLQHAVILSYVDGEQSQRELELLDAMVKRLRVPAPEAEMIIDAANRRAKRLLELL